MDSMIQDVQSLYDIAVTNLSIQVQASLQNSRVSQGIVESVGSIFDNCQQVFEGLQTNQQQLPFFRTNFNFVVSLFYVQHLQLKISCIYIAKDPIKIVLGTKKKPQGFGSKRRLIEKEEVLVYVPVLQTLQALLSNETVLSEVIYTFRAH